MRQVKALLALSFSVFLLALSFALVTGRLWRPAEARAQGVTGFVATGLLGGGPSNAQNFYAVTGDGQVWGFTVTGFNSSVDPSAWSMTSDMIGFLGQAPVGGTQSTVGDLKDRFGGRQ